MSRSDRDYRNTMRIGYLSHAMSLVPLVLAWRLISRMEVDGGSWVGLLTYGGAVLLLQTILLAISLFIVLPEGGVGLTKQERISAGWVWLSSLLVSLSALVAGLLVGSMG